MSLEIHPDIMAMGAAILAAGGALIPRRGLGAVVPTPFIGGGSGAVAYPLAFSLFMGYAGAMTMSPDHGWRQFRFVSSIYLQSALWDMMPRGAVLGALAGVSSMFWRGRVATSRPRAAVVPGSPLRSSALAMIIGGVVGAVACTLAFGLHNGLAATRGYPRDLAWNRLKSQFLVSIETFFFQTTSAGVVAGASIGGLLALRARHWSSRAPANTGAAAARAVARE
jgi:hypothetical protein